MASIEAAHYAGRRVKRVRPEQGAVLVSARDLRKLVAKAYDAGASALAVEVMKRRTILSAFWSAVPDGTMFIALSEGMGIDFVVDGTTYFVNTAGCGKRQPYRSFLEDSVVAQVRAAALAVKVSGDQS